MPVLPSDSHYSTLIWMIDHHFPTALPSFRVTLNQVRPLYTAQADDLPLSMAPIITVVISLSSLLALLCGKN